MVSWFVSEKSRIPWVQKDNSAPTHLDGDVLRQHPVARCLLNSKANPLERRQMSLKQSPVQFPAASACLRRGLGFGVSPTTAKGSPKQGNTQTRTNETCLFSSQSLETMIGPPLASRCLENCNLLLGRWSNCHPFPGSEISVAEASQMFNT